MVPLASIWNLTFLPPLAVAFCLTNWCASHQKGLKDVKKLSKYLLKKVDICHLEVLRFVGQSTREYN